MILIWSNQAKISYFYIIDDLLDRWNPSVAGDFENRTNSLLDELKKHTKFCPPSKRKKLRKCVIHKNISLIYKINRPNIELVTFINNKTNHNY